MEARRRRLLRRVTGFVAGGAWVVASILVVLNLTVLRTSWWMGALDGAHAFERVYTEVLADPGTEMLVGDLLGGWPVDPSLIAGNLRTVIPPATLRRTVEGLLDETTSYLDGSTDAIDATVALEPLWQSIERVLDANVKRAIESTPSFNAVDAEQFRINLVDFVARIAQGQKPDFLPNVPLEDSTLESVTQALLGPIDAETRAALEPDVRLALSEGDLNGALAIVGTYYAKPLLDSSIIRLRQRVDSDRVDLTVTLSAMKDEPAVRFLSTLRSVLGWSRLPLEIGLVILAIGSAIASALLVRREAIDRIRWIVDCLMVSGAAALGAWVLLRIVLGDPFDSIYRNTSVPIGIADVVRDVGEDLLHDADSLAVRVTLLPAVLGTIVALSTIAVRVLPRVRSVDHRTLRIASAAAAIVALGVSLVAIPIVWPNADVVRGDVCNGRADLCDLRLDEVVLPGSHNSQAAADAEFLGPNQDWTMPVQMDVGVRALLIKSMYWESPTIAESFLSSLAPRTVSTLRSLIDVAIPQRPGTWMCHNLCALGATPLEQGFRWIREFVEAHPDEVLVVIIGDSIVPEDTFAAADAAALTDRILVPDDDPDAPWPTLRTMIDERRNVVVFSENFDVPGTWYRNFFRYGMETPYNFGVNDNLTCIPNRGGDDKHLLLMNNWVTRAMASRLDAGPVNDPVAVSSRAKICGEERDHMVNIVAANFVDIPDIFQAVDGLNNLAVLRHDHPADDESE